MTSESGPVFFVINRACEFLQVIDPRVRNSPIHCIIQKKQPVKDRIELKKSSLLFGVEDHLSACSANSPGCALI